MQMDRTAALLCHRSSCPRLLALGGISFTFIQRLLLVWVLESKVIIQNITDHIIAPLTGKCCAFRRIVFSCIGVLLLVHFTNHAIRVILMMGQDLPLFGSPDPLGSDRKKANEIVNVKGGGTVMSKIIARFQIVPDKVCGHKYTGLTVKTPFVNFSFAPTLFAAPYGAVFC